ncbi:S41 family peptidase [Actinocorallia populi]|uniref:S41 family peptidase n=1 Tax=Actinocorallia populi TaxID=2079200 RepID=UPI000D08F38D|nr:S41 family peptidase [Actinocorallia populi]
MNTEIHDYLDTVLTLMEDNALRRGRVDWPAVRRRAHEATAEAASTADVYGVIRAAIDVLGDPHTFFLTPQEVAESFGEEAAQQAPMPSGRLVDGRFALVDIPSATGVEDADRRYVRTGAELVRDLDGHRPQGWIVDLRGNTGGNMYPMLTVLAPLLGDGVLGWFADADGQPCGHWILREGVVHHDDAPVSPRPHPYRLADPGHPIAILTGPNTMSAGEATLIAFRGLPHVRSFGAPTAGLATGNAAIELDDGALLGLTTVQEADRTGRIYGTDPIAPDQPVPPDGDALQAAVDWLAAR